MPKETKPLSLDDVIAMHVALRASNKGFHPRDLFEEDAEDGLEKISWPEALAIMRRGVPQELRSRFVSDTRLTPDLKHYFIKSKGGPVTTDNLFFWYRRAFQATFDIEELQKFVERYEAWVGRDTTVADTSSIEITKSGRFLRDDLSFFTLTQIAQGSESYNPELAKAAFALYKNNKKSLEHYCIVTSSRPITEAGIKAVSGALPKYDIGPASGRTEPSPITEMTLEVRVYAGRPEMKEKKTLITVAPPYHLVQIPIATKPTAPK